MAPFIRTSLAILFSIQALAIAVPAHAADPQPTQAASSDRSPGADTAAEPAKPRARPHGARHGHHPASSASSALDDRVKLLATELKLDERQQAGVREALISERTQTLKVWQDSSVPAQMRIKTTQDIAVRTEDRIRALLNDEQRKKYIQPKPDEAGKSGDDAQTWIDRMQGK